ncbi:MAG: leucine-rich repeat protein [Bacteroidales bacterium]|nr:leucine-rich repeat protein [Bacteroidales bacterium]
MKTKIRKYGLIICLVVCVVLCSGLGSAFMRAPAEDSAEGIETYASGTDVTETVTADSFSEGTTYETDEGVCFQYSSTYGGYVVTGHTGPCTEAYIPDTLTVSVSGTNHTYPVVRIEDEAFRADDDIIYIRIGRYVKYVGKGAFYNCKKCTALDYFAENAVSGGVTEYDESVCAFGYVGYTAGACSIFIGETVETVPECMFMRCFCSSLTFAEGSQLKEIGTRAFYNMLYAKTTVIPEIRIPDTVETVGESAFDYTYAEVEALYIPESLNKAGTAAFGLRYVDAVYYNAVDFPDCDSSSDIFDHISYSNKKATVYIGRNVTRIPAYLFYTRYGNVYINEVSIDGADDGGYALESIGSYAFGNCTELDSVTLPMGVETIEPHAFDGCSSLTSVTLGDTDGWYVTDGNGDRLDDHTQDLFSQSYMSDASTVSTYLKTTYADCCFHYTDGFTYALSSDGTYYSVTGCTGDGGAVTLTETHKAKPVKEVGAAAFKDNTSVTSVVVPECVETIGWEAFSGCTKLVTLTIQGSGLKEVGSDAFYNCSALESLYVSDTSAFVSVDYDGRYANPLALVSSNNGKFYVGGSSYTSITINGTDRIGTYALAYCTLITSVTIDGSVETIGDYAFCGETSLSSIAIPASVTYIGESAFSSTSLSTVTFASNSGWTVASGSTEVKLAASDLQANAKDFLTSTYAGYVWTRTVYDHSAPTVESKTENGGYTNSAISITTTVDGGSSIWYIAYTDPAGNTYYVYDHSLTLSPENLTVGMYTFVSVDTDEIESAPYYITFDNVAPDLYVGGMAAWVNYSSTEFSVMAYDSSPVTMYSSRDGGNTWTLCESNPYTIYPEDDYGTDGEYWFKAEDAAGNVTGPYYTVLDTIAVTGEWETGDDLYPYFYYEAPSYTTWTCTMNGEPYASGTKLKTCQMTYYVSLVGKNGTSLTDDYTLYHIYPEEGVYTEPTCSAYGYTTYSCVFCGDSYIVVDLNSTTGSHNYEERRVEPNCTEKGSYWYVCVDCGDSTTPVDIDALGHDPVADQMIAATCTTDGYTGKICSRCGVLLEGEIIAATGHNYLAVSYSATCQELAKTVYTCSVCGDSFEVTTGVYLADHVWGDWTHESPTCTETGFESRQCEVCGETEEYVLKAAGHSYTSAVWHEWTDEDTGKIYRYRYCDLCGEDGIDWYDADDPTEVASNGVIDIFKKYQQYMWWILLAFVAVWSIIIGLRWALQRNDQEKVRTRSMLANYVIGLFVIAIILVGLPYLIYAIALLV